MTVVDLQQIAGLDVHRGKDPSVELRIAPAEGAKDQYREAAQERSLAIRFPGDMERQRFVETLVAVHEQLQNGDEDDEESEKDEGAAGGGADGEDDEDGDEKEASDDEVVQALLYE